MHHHCFQFQNFDLKIILKKLYSFGCRNLLVEGGKDLSMNFLKNKLFNQFYLFKNSMNLSKIGLLPDNPENPTVFKTSKSFKSSPI